MDRWGPSEDCPSCGQIQSYGDFEQCVSCGKTICKDCKGWHKCDRIEADFERAFSIITN